MGATHVLTILAVDDPARAASFYQLAFGWNPSVIEPAYVELALPRGMRIGLHERSAFSRITGALPPPLPPGSVTSTQIYLHVDDVDAKVRCAVAAGARLLSGAQAHPWGDRAAYLCDPHGNVLAIARPEEAQDDEATLNHLADRWMSLWQGADLSLIDELHAPDFVDHGAVGRRPDRAGVRDGILELRQAFPDFHATTEDRILDVHRAKIVLRWTATGTHRGDLPGVPASGKVVLFRGIEILQARAGKIVERWGEWDQSGWLGEPFDRTA